jgi:hypothetical protein
MSDVNEKWRELAEQASAEKDPKKLLELVEQLNQVLKADGKDPSETSERQIA